MTYYYDVFSSKLGVIGIVWMHAEGAKRYLVRLFLPDKEKRITTKIKQLFPQTKRSAWMTLRNRIKKYLRGEASSFYDIKLSVACLSAFQRKVYAYQRRLKRGKVISYGELGNRVGMLYAARAIGSTQRCNPFPLIIPCHKVIRSNSAIGGFQSGITMKWQLLELEGIECRKKAGKYFVKKKHIME
ncbi:methylated-DNA--[protein]-cysteine S-methyltransferase [Candidatus Omnitrophota bacterium]